MAVATFNEVPFPRLGIALKKYGAGFRRDARKALTAANGRATGSLWNSISYELREGRDELRLTLSMAEHGKFTDEGVTGHGRITWNYSGRKTKVERSIATPPFRFRKGPVGPDAERSFAEWIRARGIKPRDSRGRFIPQTPANMRSLNFLLRRSTGAFGIAPKRFFTDAAEKWEQWFFERGEFQKAVSIDIRNYVNQIIKPNEWP